MITEVMYCYVMFGGVFVCMFGHGRLQNFETTWAKFKGWGLRGVSIGVVSNIFGCGHLLMDPGHA